MIHPYRSRNLAELGRKLDFSFNEEDDFDLLTQLQDFQLFGKGRNRSIKRVLRHQHGLMDFDISIFDYQYTKWSERNTAKNKMTYQTVFFIQSQQLSLPEILLQPETFMYKIGEILGFKDIDFVRFPKFSGQYRLTGGDEEYIRHHFTDEVLNYFTINKGWTVEGLGFYLVIYRQGLLIPSAQIEEFYQQGQQVFGLLSDEEARNRLFGKG